MPGRGESPRTIAHIGFLFSDLVVTVQLSFFTCSLDSIHYCRAQSSAVTPPPAAAARLDSASLPLPEKKSASRPAPARADRPFRGIALILASTVFLGASDVTAKYLSATLPSIEIAWLRFLVFAMIMVPAMLPGSPLYRPQSDRKGLQLMRGVTLLASSLFFISGLRFLPIAEASATGFVSPLFVTALSIFFLSERVGMRRWIATAVGLVGGVNNV